MAKLGSFFRRLFTSIISDDNCSSPSSVAEPRQSIMIIPPLTPQPVSTITIPREPIITTRSCSASPRLASRVITKQTTIQIDSSDGNSIPHFLPSNTNKFINRRLSAPLIIHASTHHRQCRSAIVDESIEEALISPLQRLSLSSTAGTTVYHNNSVHSLGTSAGGSAGASSRNDVRSSCNSINLPSSLNNISPASGRYKRLFFMVITISYI
jgi:hypothetical protein